MYCLSDDAAVEDLVFGSHGLLNLVPEGVVVIDLSTIDPATSAKEREAFEAKGHAFLDAPVFGTKGEAEGAGLWIVVGGPRDVFEHALPVFEAISETVHYMGSGGSGAADNQMVALRLDVTNVYEPRVVEKAWDTAHPNSLEDANHPSVGCVVLNLLEIDNNAELQEQCIQNIQEIGALTRARGISLMVEPLVMKTNPEGGSTSVSDPEKIATLVRQAVELGADIIKVDPVEPMERFAEVVAIAHPKPVLVRGGGKVTTRELLERTKIAIEVGAKGVVYGRNVVQHQNPGSLVAALQAIVHNNASVDDALALVKE